ncbi:hypothetical protein ACN28S_32090 [Cystobacter fuscus]
MRLWRAGPAYGHALRFLRTKLQGAPPHGCASRNWEEAISSARKRLHELGLYPAPEDSFGGFAELYPQNAKQALGAPGILRDVGITLLAPEEFERREALFAEARAGPGSIRWAVARIFATGWSMRWSGHETRTARHWSGS